MKNFYDKRMTLSFNSRADALEVANLLLNNGYLVLLSEEGEFTMLNIELGYEYNSERKRTIADRNYVVFMSSEDFEELYFNKEEE